MLAELTTLPQDGLTLHYARGSADEAPLLLLHGVGRRWQDFLTVLPPLLCRWRVFALDFRGHGLSDRAEARYLVADYLADARTLLEQQCTEPAVVFGHSLGALVALGLAATCPDRVRAIILEDPPAMNFLADLERTPYYALFVAMRELAGSKLSVSEVTSRLAELRLPGPSGPYRLGDVRDGASLRFSARCLHLLDPAVLDPVLDRRWLEGFLFDDWAARVTCPSLLLRGDVALGGMLPAADAERLCACLNDVLDVALPSLGHQIHTGDPTTTLRIVTPFLESLR